MRTLDFINQAIGSLVYVHEASFRTIGEIRPLINNKTPLRLLRWTKGGNVYLQDESNGNYYTLPPRAIREL